LAVFIPVDGIKEEREEGEIVVAPKTKAQVAINSKREYKPDFFV
jgi:hypothetical protein